MTDFNLEQAKEGAKVRTRDGRKVEILKFNLNNERPILAVITENDGRENPLCYFLDGRLEKRYIPDDNNGRKLVVIERNEDLMMVN